MSENYWKPLAAKWKMQKRHKKLLTMENINKNRKKKNKKSKKISQN